MSGTKETFRPPDAYPVSIPAVETVLEAKLTLPAHAAGLVVFSQDKDSSTRHFSSSGIIECLGRYKLATLQTDSPATTYIALWLQQNYKTAGLPLGYFAAGKDAAAALVTAAQQPEWIKAVVCCSGRPDTAAAYLADIKAPVLLIAGGRDPAGQQSCQAALKMLNRNSTLNVIPAASSRFDEPGAMEQAVQLAALWFSEHLG